MRKYLFYIIPFLFLALVVGFKPTTAYAADSYIYPDRSNVDGYRLYVSIDILSYGEWVSIFSQGITYGQEDVGFLFDINDSDIDHVNGDNFRVRFYYDYDSFLSSNTYSFENYFEFVYGHQDYYATFAKVNTYYGLGPYGNYFAPLYSGVGLSDSYPMFYIDISPVIDTTSICIEFSSNFHEQFQSEGDDVRSYFLIGSGSLPISYSSFVPMYPDNVLPDVNIDGLPNFGDYKPSGALGAFFDTLFSYRYVAVGMLMTLTLGVVSFLLFGERK